MYWRRPGRALRDGLYALRTPNPGRSRSREAGFRPPVTIPSRKTYGTPRRGQSVPRPAFGVAMLTPSAALFSGLGANGLRGDYCRRSRPYALL